MHPHCLRKTPWWAAIGQRIKPFVVSLLEPYLYMKTNTTLTSSHQRTFDRIFQHPISHNLEWRDVHALLAEMGQVAKEHNGSLKVTRNGQTLVLHPTSSKDVAEVDEVMSLRHFLERSESPSPETMGK